MMLLKELIYEARRAALHVRSIVRGHDAHGGAWEQQVHRLEDQSRDPPRSILALSSIQNTSACGEVYRHCATDATISTPFTSHRGGGLVNWQFLFAAAAYNLVWMRTLQATARHPPPDRVMRPSHAEEARA